MIFIYSFADVVEPSQYSLGQLNWTELRTEVFTPIFRKLSRVVSQRPGRYSLVKKRAGKKKLDFTIILGIH